MRIGLREIVRALCGDIAQKLPMRHIVAKFFNTLSHIALHIAQTHMPIDSKEVFFSGGVFANKILCEKITALFAQNGLMARFPTQYPSNDACISFGQILATLARTSH